MVLKAAFDTYSDFRAHFCYSNHFGTLSNWNPARGWVWSEELGGRDSLWIWPKLEFGILMRCLLKYIVSGSRCTNPIKFCGLDSLHLKSCQRQLGQREGLRLCTAAHLWTKVWVHSTRVFERVHQKLTFIRTRVAYFHVLPTKEHDLFWLTIPENWEYFCSNLATELADRESWRCGGSAPVGSSKRVNSLHDKRWSLKVVEDCNDGAVG